MSQPNRYGTRAVRSYRTLIDPLIAPLRPKVVRACLQLNARSVLDIASGTGAQCRALGDAGIQATGLDLSEDMVAHARSAGGRYTHYVPGSALELPFEDASFDAATLVLALHEHPEVERRQMLSEAVRISRRGLIIAEFEQPRRRVFHPAWQLIRLIEYSAGAEHHAGFIDFVATGGLNALADRHRLNLIETRSSHFGALMIGIVSGVPS